jgi:hypothetical protein
MCLFQIKKSSLSTNPHFAYTICKPTAKKQLNLDSPAKLFTNLLPISALNILCH